MSSASDRFARHVPRIRLPRRRIATEKESTDRELPPSSARPGQDAAQPNAGKGAPAQNEHSKLFHRAYSILCPCHSCCTPSLKHRINMVLESWYFSSLILLVTMIALYGDDVLMAALPKAADAPMETVYFICLLLFLGELITLSNTRTGYIFSFYFWLDLVAAVSMVPDITWLSDFIVGLFGGTVSGEESQFSIARAGRAARAGTRAGKILRMVRILRLIRVAKLFNVLKEKFSSKSKTASDDESTVVQVEGDDQNLTEAMDARENRQSEVWRQSTEIISRKVILGVLLMLLVFPWLLYEVADNSMEYGIAQLSELPEGASLERAIDLFRQQHTNLIFLAVRGQVIVNNPDPSLRDEEIQVFLAGGNTEGHFNNKDEIRGRAELSIILTSFVILLLGAWSALFSRDIHRLFVDPIERMTKLVRQIAENPVGALEEQSDSSGQHLETSIIENAIMKIGGLLQIGFGEAGSSIISRNLSSSGSIDPALEGTRTQAIYGFCDIRKFTDTTERLQEYVMPFVNSIAKVVHGACHEHKGNANKNIGDAFLLVWKLKADAKGNVDRLLLEDVAQHALQATIECLVLVEKDDTIRRIVRHPVLQQSFPGYVVKLGYGLHTGWSIEGAIGSKYKIDASYLSPHVNITGSLEEMTKEYGVPLLFSGQFAQALPEGVRNRCRRLDCVPTKSSSLEVWTFDTMAPPHSANRLTAEFSACKQEQPDSDELREQERLLELFYAKFRNGQDAYVTGMWGRARELLQEALNIWPSDGPSLALMEYMGQYAFEAPSHWNGVRV